MSLRTLPAAPILSHRTIGNRGTVQADAAPPKAFDRWDMTIRAADESDANISIFGLIGEGLFGDGPNTARRIAAVLRSMKDRDVTVLINSPGGNFHEGLAIYSLLREHKGAVTVKILGIAASAAAVIAMAADTVEIALAGSVMIHNTQAETLGDRHDHRQTIDILEPFDDGLANIFAARAKLDRKIIVMMLDEGVFITGNKAIEQGFADKLLSADEVVSDPKLRAEAGPVVAAHKADAIFARQGLPRSERRKLLKEIRGVTPGADATGMPGAADQESPLGDVLSALKSITLT